VAGALPAAVGEASQAAGPAGHGACGKMRTENGKQWIGLRENLQETMVFTIKYRGFGFKFSHHPIL
jgi:hypothetical protein